jgi:hypothetical protein
MLWNENAFIFSSSFGRKHSGQVKHKSANLLLLLEKNRTRLTNQIDIVLRFRKNFVLG